MKKTVKKSPHRQTIEEPRDVVVELPATLLETLSDTRSAFFGLCLEAGRSVLTTMMEEDRVELCGAKGKQDANRTAVRAGSAPSWVTLSGRRVEVPGCEPVRWTVASWCCRASYRLRPWTRSTTRRWSRSPWACPRASTRAT